jgi:HSP20 family protein
MATNRWWGPNTDVMTATRLIDRMFDQFFGYGGSPGDRADQGGTPTYALPVDVLETDDSFLLFATVAGVPSENVDVTFEDGVLSLTVKAAPFERQGKLLRQERPWGNWSRKLELPKEVQPDAISADVENGVLRVTVPKAAQAQPVRIPVGSTGERRQLKS